MANGLTYRDAGVDSDAGDALVEAIKPFAKRTLRPEVLAGLGGFRALCSIPAKYREPLLVSGTDGVGTQLKLAFLLGRHNTVGIDLVAMSANDVLGTGGEPAEMPGMYPEGEYDLAGFCVGVVEKEKIINGSSIKPGAALIGLASSGAPSNGSSLIRRIVGEDKPSSDLSDTLMEPTRI